MIRHAHAVEARVLAPGDEVDHVGYGHPHRNTKVDLHAMAWLLLGSIPGILLTSQFTLKVPERALRLGLAAVLMLSGIKLVDPPNSDWVIAAGAVVAGLAFATWALLQRRPRRPSATRNGPRSTATYCAWSAAAPRSARSTRWPSASTRRRASTSSRCRPSARTPSGGCASWRR